MTEPQYQIYVVVTHNDSQRSFALNRSYGLITGLEDRPRADMLLHAQDQGLAVLPGEHACGWLPSGRWQMPEWAWELEEQEFDADWYRLSDRRGRPAMRWEDQNASP